VHSKVTGALRIARSRANFASEPRGIFSLAMKLPGKKIQRDQ
jgi:hypothetical protein